MTFRHWEHRQYQSEWVSAILTFPFNDIVIAVTRLTFKLFPGLPRITFFGSSPFFLGGIFFDFKQKELVWNAYAGNDTRTCRDRCDALTVNTDKQSGMH